MNRAFAYVLIGATLWGTISLFVKNLYDLGFTPMEVVTIRVLFTSLILLPFLLISSRRSLKLKQFSDIRYFIGTGVLSIVFFNFSLFKTIELSTVPIATTLLYTGPAFVIIISYFLFKERLTHFKVSALLLTLIGSALVVNLIPLDLDNFPLITVFFGLCSGFGYALYSIFSKFALRKYSSITITAYTFFVATIALLPFFPYREKALILLEPKAMFFAIGFGLFPTTLAYLIYTAGLNRTETSKAAIVSTVEPVVATLIGIFVFLEPFTFIQTLGMGAIITAVILIQLDPITKQT